MAKRQRLDEDTLSSSPPTSSAHMPDLEHECVICFAASSNTTTLPCCYQGEKRICSGCLTDMLDNHKEGDFKCPCCRCPLNKNLEHFAAFMRTLKLPLAVVDVLLNPEGPKTFVPLVDPNSHVVDDDPMPVVGDYWECHDNELNDAWFNEYHCELTCLSQSTVDQHPFWANLYFDHQDKPVLCKIPISKLSVPGDDIHTFVRDKCGSKWPRRGVHVELVLRKVKLIPIHYEFLLFKWVEEVAVAVFHPTGNPEVMGNNYFAPVYIPLSIIDRFQPFDMRCIWKSFGSQHVDSTAGLDEDMPIEAVIKLPGRPYARMDINRVKITEYGPLLEMASIYPNSDMPRQVYLSQITTMYFAYFFPDSQPNPMRVLNYDDVLFSGAIVIPKLRGKYYTQYHNKECVFMGFSFGSDGPKSCRVFIRTMRGHHFICPVVSQFHSLTFVRYPEVRT